MKLRCKKSGQDIVSVQGWKLACQICCGVIVIEGNRVRLEKPLKEFRTFPKKALCGFDCPATTIVLDENGNIKEEFKEYVEVIE